MSIDKLRARYNANELRFKVFFGGTDSEMTIYTTPMTVGDVSKLEHKKIQDDSMYSVELIMLKALNAEREPMFKGVEDKMALKECVTSSDIQEIASWILSDSENEEGLKNE